jgi:hypothetical protein
MSTSNQFGKYEILDELGRRGFAVVYRARDTALDRVVALKVLAPHLTWDPRFVERFHHEAKAVARLRHPNIVVVHEIGEQAGQVYIAMEYLDGRTLAQVIADEDALPLDRATAILVQVADALDYAHEQGVLHRDVKPANIMVEEGGRVRLRTTLMDFGLVKAMESNESLTSMGTVLGSPEYMAPEQVDSRRKDEIGPPTDRYALGVVAYHVLTGQVPFSGPTTAVLHAHAYESPPDPQGIRESLAAGVAQVLLKALSKEAENRYTSATEMVEALRGAQAAPAPSPIKVVTGAEVDLAPRQEPDRDGTRPEPAAHEQAVAADREPKARPLRQRPPATPKATRFDALALRVSKWLPALAGAKSAFWLRWVLINAGGSVIAQITVAIVIAITSPYLYSGIGWAVGEFRLLSVIWWTVGCLFAVEIGSTQWIALKARFSQAHWWALASALGSLPGWVAGAYTVHYARAFLSYNDGMLAWVGLWVVFGIVFQVLVGVGQWIVLRTQVRPSAQWVWACALGSAAGGAIGGALAWLIYTAGGTGTGNMPLSLVAGAVGRIASRTIVEAIAGLTLARLVRTEEQIGT